MAPLPSGSGFVRDHQPDEVSQCTVRQCSSASVTPCCGLRSSGSSPASAPTSIRVTAHCTSQSHGIQDGTYYTLPPTRHQQDSRPCPSRQLPLWDVVPLVAALSVQLHRIKLTGLEKCAKSRGRRISLQCCWLSWINGNWLMGLSKKQYYISIRFKRETVVSILVKRAMELLTLEGCRCSQISCHGNACSSTTQ
jgi:hypothetical protein